MSQPQQKLKKWRTSASIIIVAPNGNQHSTTEYDYNLLMVKRSDRTSIVENQTVFPGGLLDTTADEDVAWLEYFESFGVSQDILRRLVLTRDNGPAILAPQGTGCYDRFFKRSQIWAREITLRLTALRECFEEVGILLCRTRVQLVELNGDVPPTHFKEDFKRKAWQQRVHNNPSEFLVLCQTLQVVPDLWGLHEWSVWATPAAVKNGHETAFFMAFVDGKPNVLAEESEIKDCIWSTARELLHMFQLGEIWFLPPQIYELRRILGMKAYQNLLIFAQKRSKLGSTLYLPVSYICSDTIVNLLPGDDFYPREPHLATEFVSFDGTAAEFRSLAKNLHRSENFGTPSFRYFVNIPMPNGHLAPQDIPSERQKL